MNISLPWDDIKRDHGPNACKYVHELSELEHTNDNYHSIGYDGDSVIVMFINTRDHHYIFISLDDADDEIYHEPEDRPFTVVDYSKFPVNYTYHVRTHDALKQNINNMETKFVYEP